VPGASGLAMRELLRAIGGWKAAKVIREDDS
jgi:hypothetical protein